MVAARLAARGEPREAVLRSVTLDEPRWLAIEQGWLLRIATAMLQQDLGLAQDHDEALRAAREALRSGQGEGAGAAATPGDPAVLLGKHV